MINLWTLALIIFLINLPFGFWRAGTEKLKLPWFLATHLPVLIIIILRIISGIGWRFITFPVFVCAFFAGQFLGGRLYSDLKN